MHNFIYCFISVHLLLCVIMLQIHRWSIQEFSQWLDKHTSEEERLAAVKFVVVVVVVVCMQLLRSLIYSHSMVLDYCL